MEWFEREHLIDRYPAVAVHGALIFALTGRAIEAERWTAAAERAPRDGVLADGSTMESLLAYLRVNLCRDGLDRMHADARAACDGLAASSPYRATMLNAEGIAALHEGDLDAADPIFVRAYDAAIQAGSVPLEVMIRAERALIAIAGDRWSDAEDLIRGALDMVATGDLDDYWTSGLVFAVAGHAAAHGGQLDRAHDYAARTARLRPLLTYALPNLSAQTLLELARVYAALGDTAGASAVLRELRDIVQQRPALGLLPQQADELRARLDSRRDGALGASSLTNAELRLAPHLPTHLTFPEIAERLHVSRHTVKTQAISIYQKLGVSSRTDAIDKMQELGLLDR